MKSLDLLSERVPPSGAFRGIGVERLLGTPNIDDLTLLIREAIQNSWDAREPADKDGTVDFAFRMFTFSGPRLSRIKELFKHVPKFGSYLPSLLERPELIVAEIRDTGTCGLNGPIRADRWTEGPQNYIDFILNIGSPQDRDVAGGTYGFGKGSYYRASEAKAILIHTRALERNGTVESRLIGLAIGDPYTEDGFQYTGRHSWGVINDESGFCTPLLNEVADEIADDLGIGVPVGETGTSISILGFRNDFFAEDSESDESGNGNSSKVSLEEIARSVAHQMVWQCWPKMVKRKSRNSFVIPMNFSVECEGEKIPIPDLESIPSLKYFVKCLKEIHEGNEGVIAIQSKRPKKFLGHLAISEYVAKNPRQGLGTEELSGFQVPYHHVAYLRAPELVVRYKPYSKPDFDEKGWAAVFLADSEVDPSFAAAEPPTHDDWVISAVREKEKRTDVSVAIREIQDEVQKKFANIRPVFTSSDTPVAGLSEQIGQMFLTPGTGSSSPTLVSPKKRETSQKKGQQIRSGRKIVEQLSVRYDQFDGVPALLVEVEKVPRNKYSAEVSVVLDGDSKESAPPVDSSVPKIICWLLNGEVVSNESELSEIPETGKLEVVVEHVPAILTRLEVRREEVS